ncbi:MAG TPA: hypothetical protein VG960_12580 [Caulobacteraceae bacterium]|nr:hypothetical protein [Caulobacteraceae bacterium]
MTLRPALALSLLASLIAGAAQAQTPIYLSPQPKPLFNLSDPRLSIAPRHPAATGEPPANRTSVDHTFGPQKVTAAVGFLCGLEPLSDRTPGPASTFGPVGTFLGGKLTYAFK